MRKKAISLIVLLLLAGCGNAETATTQITTATTAAAPATTATTTAVTEKATEKATTAKMTDREAKTQDVKTAGDILNAFTYTLADEAAFDDFYPLVEQGGVIIQPFEDGSYVYIFPDGAKTTKLEAVLNEKLKGINPAFSYYAKDWEPVIWVLNVDDNFRPYICIYTDSEKLVELLPNTDPMFN